MVSVDTGYIKRLRERHPIDVTTAPATHATDIMTETDIVVLHEGTEGFSMESYAGALRERLPDQTVMPVQTPKQEHGLVVDARIVTGITIGEDLPDRANRLELFACMFVGTNHVLMDTLADRDVAVTNAGSIHAPGIAEQAIGNILVFTYQPREGRRRRERAEWRYPQLGKFTDSMVTVIDLGSIGQATVQHL